MALEFGNGPLVVKFGKLENALISSSKYDERDLYRTGWFELEIAWMGSVLMHASSVPIIPSTHIRKWQPKA